MYSVKISVIERDEKRSPSRWKGDVSLLFGPGKMQF
jgi:hypothetical protein